MQLTLEQVIEEKGFTDELGLIIERIQTERKRALKNSKVKRSWYEVFEENNLLMPHSMKAEFKRIIVKESKLNANARTAMNELCWAAIHNHLEKQKS